MSMIKDEQKLAVGAISKESFDNMLNISREGLLKFGKLSIPYLMRKLKCTRLMAYKIMEIFGQIE